MSRERVAAAGGRVIVIGAINIDLVVVVHHLPRAGETVLGGDLTRHNGGKGANQAVAAARAGGRVTMVGAVGTDADGDAALDSLRAEGVDVHGVRRLEAPTGAALIAVDAGGENQIVVAPGANGRLDGGDLPPMSGADVVLASLEVPMTTVVTAAGAASAGGARLIVNPAPAAPLPAEILAADPIVVANRAEVGVVAGIDDLDAATVWLLEAGCTAVVVTRGAEGVSVLERGRRSDLPALLVAQVRDTTGAGDTFCGVLATWLAGGASVLDAATAANAAAGLSVQHAGARSGMPRREGILRAMRAVPS